MKTPEDEAFDELARKQGAWGGGFKAKQAMAADKLQEPAKEPVSFPCCGYTDANAIRWNQFNGVVQCHMCGQVYTVAQPAQEPYDQTALELCNVCGWKTLIPDDCCLNCERAQPAQEPVAWTTMPEAEDWCFVSGNKDPNGKLEGKWFPLYTTPPQRERVVFPTMLRKMWSGGEVQAWLDENVNKEKNNG